MVSLSASPISSCYFNTSEQKGHAIFANGEKFEFSVNNVSKKQLKKLNRTEWKTVFEEIVKIMEKNKLN